MTDPDNKWYHNPLSIFFAIALFGPLGLIPLWTRPRTGLFLKISISGVVLALTVWLCVVTGDMVAKVMALYKEAMNIR